MEGGGVLVGGARDALDERAVDAGAQLDRGAVRANRDEVSGRDAAPAGVTARERDLLGGALELELCDPLDLVPREERRVPKQAERADEVAVPAPGGVGRHRAGGLGRHVRRTRRERGVLAELLE